MDGEFSTNWTSWLDEAYLLYTPEHPECLKYHYLTRTEKDEPRYTVDQEIAMINQQIEESEGFDIDFSLFRCLFNYHVADPDYSDFVGNVRNEDLMKRLSQESLERHNQEEKTKFEFLKVVKANFHFCNGYIFLITFEALDLSDKLEKTMQARVFYSSHAPPKYVFCRLKPYPTVNSDETSEDDTSEDETSQEDVKAFDRSDKVEKTMQARVFYSSHAPPKYIFCRLTSDSNDNSDETSEDDSDTSEDETSKEDVKE